ncbi:unnamed protein product [Rotaria sp. Silwood2]|nr:unnamed protein product [Rotaria sp. Silwood2]
MEAMTLQTFDALLNTSIPGELMRPIVSLDHIYDWISDLLQANQFQNQQMTNWKMKFSSLEENYILRTSPVSLMNGTCYCASGMSKCTETPIFYDQNGESTILPGLVVGCSPMSGLSQSTLECFYDHDCVAKLSRFLDISFTVLNRSATRFSPTTPISVILEENLLESSSYSANYSKYFELCAPSTCQYHYTKQNTVVYIFTTLLGLYGGLTAFLQVLVWQLFRLCRCIMERCPCLLRRIHPPP